MLDQQPHVHKHATCHLLWQVQSYFWGIKNDNIGWFTINLVLCIDSGGIISDVSALFQSCTSIILQRKGPCDYVFNRCCSWIFRPIYQPGGFFCALLELPLRQCRLSHDFLGIFLLSLSRDEEPASGGSFKNLRQENDLTLTQLSTTSKYS